MWNKRILFILIWSTCLRLIAQTNNCTFTIPEVDLCPGSSIATKIGIDDLVTETDGSELIYNTNGRLISIAGWDGSGQSHNRIRYSDDDGTTWHAAPNAAFTGRHTFSIVKDDAYFYLIGGDANNTISERAEIWKSPINDGLSWTLHVNNTPFGNNVLYQVIKYAGNWYAIGGQFTENGAIFGSALRTVYVSNDKGVNWTILNQDVMPEIGTTWACTVEFKNKIWIVSGGTYNYSGIVSNKAYSTSDFITWNEDADFVLPIGVIFNRVFVDTNYIYTHCGYDYMSGNTNFTYASRDGKKWVDITNDKTIPTHATAVAVNSIGWVCNQSFGIDNGGFNKRGVYRFQISSYQKCLINTTFINTSGDNSWDNNNNWSRGFPSINHFAIIPNGATCNYNLLNSTIGKLKIDANATLNLNNNLKILKSDTFGLKNNGNLNFFQGFLEIDSIYGDGLINSGNIQILGNFFLNIKNIGCKGINNFAGIINVINQQSLNLTLLNINKTAIFNNGIIIFRGNGIFIQLDDDAINNNGSLINYGNCFIQCNLNMDSHHLINTGNFENFGIFTGQSKLGLHIFPQGILDNSGNINTFGNLNIEGVLINKDNALFSQF